MKKFILILLSLLLCLSIFGCGGESAAEENDVLAETEDAAEETIPTTPMYVVTRADWYLYSYNEIGELTAINKTGASQKEYNFTYEYEHDEAGVLTEVRRYENGLLQQVLKFNDEGNICEDVAYSGGADRREANASEYFYNADGNIEKIIRYAGAAESEHFYDIVWETAEYFYGSDGALAKACIVTNGTYEVRETCIYYNSYRLPVMKIESSYNERNNLVIYEYEYDYNNAGKPVLQKGYSNVYTDVVREFLDSEDPNKNAADYEGRWRFAEDDITFENEFSYSRIPMTDEQIQIFEAAKKAALNDGSSWYSIYYW